MYCGLSDQSLVVLKVYKFLNQAKYPYNVCNPMSDILVCARCVLSSRVVIQIYKQPIPVAGSVCSWFCLSQSSTVSVGSLSTS